MKSCIAFIFITGLALASFAGCNAFNPDLGIAPFKCGLSEPRCPDDYSCQLSNGVELCFAADKGPEDLADAGDIPGQFVCNNDGELEPNDTIQTASQTGIPQESSQRFVGLAICPAGDSDVFAFTFPPPSRTVTATLEVGTGTAPLALSLLNDVGTGTVVGEGTQDPMDASKLNLEVTSVPAGDYFIRITGAGMGENNYNVEIAISQ